MDLWTCGIVNELVLLWTCEHVNLCFNLWTDEHFVNLIVCFMWNDELWIFVVLYVILDELLDIDWICVIVCKIKSRQILFLCFLITSDGPLFPTGPSEISYDSVRRRRPVVCGAHLTLFPTVPRRPSEINLFPTALSEMRILPTGYPLRRYFRRDLP
jgi:hypothetical protein